MVSGIGACLSAKRASMIAKFAVNPQLGALPTGHVAFQAMATKRELDSISQTETKRVTLNSNRRSRTRRDNPGSPVDVLLRPQAT